MRILYDHQAFTGSIYGGVSRYFADLMSNLDANGNVINLATIFSNNFYLQDKSFYKGKSFSQVIGNRTSTMYSHLNRANAAFHLMKKKFDVFHPTFHNSYFLDFIGKKPFVVTYHDAIPEIYHERYGILDGVKFDKKKKLLEKATQIIAISENTKKDLLKFYDVNPDKVSVVHHGSKCVKYPPTTISTLESQHDYLLYIGARGLYKNFDVFIASISETLLKNNLRLLCVGGGGFSEQELLQINALGIQKNIKQISVDDATLYNLYANAVAFAYPSEYEGFGLPIIEAFAAGCPALLSNTSCFPEIAQDAGLYFDPKSKESICSQVNKLLFDEGLRKSLIQKGYERLKDFSIAKMTSETYEVYQKSVLSL